MKGKIIHDHNNISILQIKRGDNYIAQYCPFVNDDSKCGDWCPQFGEPIVNKERLEANPKDKELVYIISTALTICQNRVLSFTELKDLRS